jgi:Asp-tRNA(Asn)/Glu-tRNA(Gln) amidotransferase B subunit
VALPLRLKKFDELAKTNDPVIVAKVVANSPEEKLSDLNIQEKNIVTDEAKIKEEVQKVIAAHPKVVEDIKGGKQQAMFFLIGQIKKELGDIDIHLAQKIIREMI